MGRKCIVILLLSCCVFLACSRETRAIEQPNLSILLIDLYPDKVEAFSGIVSDVTDNSFSINTDQFFVIVEGVMNIEDYRILLLCSKVFHLKIFFRVFVWNKFDGTPERQIVSYGWP